jgi:F0F1-type ATP synthase membrane subunit b/b'
MVQVIGQMPFLADILDVLSSASFVEAVILLLLTALLTGLLVPIVKGFMDTRNLQKQRLFQEAVARKTKILDSQAELLEVLADVLGGLRMLYTRIAFYARDGRKQEYEAAFKDFEERSWNFLASYRTQLSKAGRLTSEQVRVSLRDLYYETLIPTDRRLYDLVQQAHRDDGIPAEKEAWAGFFDYLFTDFTDAIDGVLAQLTEEIREAET